MNIFFHSGINLDLSLSEIKSIFENQLNMESILIDKRNHIIGLEINLTDKQIIEIQNRLGWTIKISRNLGHFNSEDIQKAIIDALAEAKNNKEWKLRIWLNSYTNRIEVRKLLMSAKRGIKSIRFLNNNFKNIESVVTKKQILDKDWIEINILEMENVFYISKTIWIQDIQAYSLRDYDKPRRDAKVWMLPPKLAQILINLSWERESLWDPFCGLWVIPIEAYLMWFEKIIYSDVNSLMVESTEENLNWVQVNPLLKIENWKLKIENFTNDVTKFVKLQTNTVVTEWYLWTPISNFAYAKHIDETDRLLSRIWEEALENFYTNNIKTIVFCLPAFAQANNKIQFLVKSLEKIKQSKYTLLDLSNHERSTLLYRKEKQFVYREIFKLKLKAQ